MLGSVHTLPICRRNALFSRRSCNIGPIIMLMKGSEARAVDAVLPLKTPKIQFLPRLEVSVNTS